MVDVLALDEGHLDLDLGELGLAVGTEVLVAETARHLVVALDAGHHEELLELLGRLGKGVEHSRMDPRGNEVLARALGGALEEDRGLHIHETLAVEVGPHRRRHRVAEAEVSRHAWPSKIKIAVLEAQILVYVLLVEGPRGGFTAVQDVQ